MAELSPLSVFAVATSEAGDTAVNTLVLDLPHVAIPLELDVADDPLQADQVRLQSVGGTYDEVLSPGEADVEKDLDGHRLYFRFRRVPYGAYRVSVRVWGQWSDLYSDLVVRRGGVFANGKKLDQERPTALPAPHRRPEDDEQIAANDAQRDWGFLDQVEPLRKV